MVKKPPASEEGEKKKVGKEKKEGRGGEH